jgi:uncharacterized protein
VTHEVTYQRRPAAHSAARMAAGLVLVLAFVLTALPQASALTFPTLSGRVVDEAGIIPPDVRQRLDETLKALEAKSSDQLVVVTLPSLQGTDIADYGYQLGRAWGIGQKGLDNGALLIVAPNERKVRIEVGYGLEGILTDALTSVVIQRAILPKFKAGDMAGGIEAGVAAIVSALTDDQSEWRQRAADFASRRTSEGESDGFDTLIVLIIIGVWVFIMIQAFRRSWARGEQPGRSGGWRRSGSWGPIITGTSIGSGGFSSGGGSSSDGGFSGGGGSFGGGGSSGSW